MRAVITFDNATFTELPNLVRNDKGFDLQFGIKDDDDAVYDLTGKTIYFKTKLLGETVTYIDSTCSITSYSTGTITYTFQDGDLTTSGVYYAELEVNGTSFIQTIKLGKLYVQEDL